MVTTGINVADPVVPAVAMPLVKSRTGVVPPVDVMRPVVPLTDVTVPVLFVYPFGLLAGYAPRAVKALAAVVELVPPLAIKTVPVTLADVPVTLPTIGEEKVFVPAMVWLFVRSAYKVEPVKRVHVPAC